MSDDTNQVRDGGTALQLIASKRLQSKIKRILDEYELNLTQWLIISRLHTIKPGMRTTDLARFMHVEVPLVTMMSRPLRKRGLITSSAQSGDKREKMLSVTEPAEAIIADVDSRLQEQIEKMTENVSKKDMQTYLKVLVNLSGATS